MKRNSNDLVKTFADTNGVEVLVSYKVRRAAFVMSDGDQQEEGDLEITGVELEIKGGDSIQILSRLTEAQIDTLCKYIGDDE